MTRSWIIACLIALLAAAWVASGMLFGSDNQALSEVVTPEEEAAPLPQVRVTTIAAQPMINDIVLQGHTLADRTVEVRGEVSGLVAEILADRGATVEEGQVLVRIAPGDREAKLAEARALLAQREIEYRAAEQLNEQGYRADVSLAESRATLDSARAGVELAALEVERLTISAPFGGIVNERPVEVGDYIAEGDNVATIVDLDPIRVVGQLSERYLGQIEPNGEGFVRFLDGSEFEGRVSYIGRVADPETRTFAVELEIPNPDGTLIQGVTAEMRLPVDRVMAHMVNPSILALSDEGNLGVKTVDDENKVVFNEVRLLGNGPGGVWVDGLPEQARIISVGQSFVIAGQTVDPVPADRIAAGGARP